MICVGCNTALGRFGDDAEGVARALAYVTGTSAPASQVDEHW